MDTNQSQLKKIIEKRKEAKSNYGLVFVALKVVEDSVKKLEEENDLIFAKMESLLESVEKNLIIREDENAQSLAKKVQECTQTIEKEQADFQRLEEPFLSIVKGIKNPAQLFNPEGGLDERKISLSIASHILFALLKPATGKLNTPILAEVPKPPPKPVPKPRSIGFQRWVPSSTTILNKFRFQNPGTSTLKDSSLQSQQTAVSSSSIENHARHSNSSDLRRNSISAPLSLPGVSQDEVVNPLESIRSPPPVPPRNTSSSNPMAVPSTENIQPPGTNSTTMRKPLPNPDSISRPYSRYSWVFPLDMKIDSDL